MPLFINIINGVFQKHSPTTGTSMITEVATVLCTSKPMVKAIGKGGPLSPSYFCHQYYKESFNIIEPTEYIFNAKERKAFNMCLY